MRCKYLQTVHRPPTLCGCEGGHGATENAEETKRKMHEAFLAIDEYRGTISLAAPGRRFTPRRLIIIELLRQVGKAFAQSNICCTKRLRVSLVIRRGQPIPGRSR